MCVWCIRGCVQQDTIVAVVVVGVVVGNKGGGPRLRSRDSSSENSKSDEISQLRFDRPAAAARRNAPSQAMCGRGAPRQLWPSAAGW